MIPTKDSALLHAIRSSHSGASGRQPRRSRPSPTTADTAKPATRTPAPICQLETPSTASNDPPAPKQRLGSCVRSCDRSSRTAACSEAAHIRAVAATSTAPPSKATAENAKPNSATAIAPTTRATRTLVAVARRRLDKPTRSSRRTTRLSKPAGDR